MNVEALSAACLALVVTATNASELRRVPERLFGIELGREYDVGDAEKGDLGDVPVKKVTGMQKGLSHGIHYYFKPLRDYESFKYIEKKAKPGDKYFSSSFRLYMVPVIPDGITSFQELEKVKLRFRVGTIEWSDNKVQGQDAYFWAMDLCKTFEADLAIKPAITNYYDQHWYQCVFKAENRELKVDSSVWAIVTLQVPRAVADREEDRLDALMHKLKAEKIRPY